MKTKSSVISVDYGAQPQYWLLFDRIVQQLVLQSESQVDNDVEPLRSVDVKELVQHLAKEEEVIRLRYVSELGKITFEMILIKDQYSQFRLYGLRIYGLFGHMVRFLLVPFVNGY